MKKKSQLTLYRATGCPHCNYKGYRGRTGIHELLLVDDKVQALIRRGRRTSDRKHIRDYTPSIRQDGLDKVIQGITSLEEVMRVTKRSHNGGV